MKLQFPIPPQTLWQTLPSPAQYIFHDQHNLSFFSLAFICSKRSCPFNVNVNISSILLVDFISLVLVVHSAKSTIPSTLSILISFFTKFEVYIVYFNILNACLLIKND